MRTLFFATLIFGASSVPSVFSQSAETEDLGDLLPAGETIQTVSPAGEEDVATETVPIESDLSTDSEEVTEAAMDSEPLGTVETTESPEEAMPPDGETADAPASSEESVTEPVSPPVVSETSTPPPTPASVAPIVVQVANDELIGRMAIMEQFLVAQHEREIALYRDTIKLVIVFGVGFAVVAGLGLLAACFLNYRAIVAVQAVVLRHPAETEEPTVSGLLPPSSAAVPGIERVQASGTRFQSRMSKLEDRLNELEHMTGHDAGDESYGDVQSGLVGDADEVEVPQIEAPPPRRVIPRAAIMVHKAQTLMNLGRFSEALATLDEAATFDGPNSEVQLARGQALEKLGRIPDAIDAYDHAVEIDQSNTNALLMKAGALNRQEKFTEALECYERALEVHRAVS